MQNCTLDLSALFSIICCGPISTMLSLQCEQIYQIPNMETNIIIDGGEIVNINGDLVDLYSDDVEDLLVFIDWGENAVGPDCHLCGQGIIEDTNCFIYKGTSYSVIVKDFIVGSSWDTGSLQCVYCFNYFHRNRCNITISDRSYFNIIYSKNWACPNCVPIFKSMTNSAVFCNSIDYEKLLHKLVKVLNPFRDQLSDLYFTIIDFKCKYKICISMLENRGIG